MRRAALALVLVCVPACSGRLEKVVRRQAAEDFRCPEGQVDLKLRRSQGYIANYDVAGCGQEAIYQGACSLVTCSAYEPQRVRRPRAGQGAAAQEGGEATPDPSAPSGAAGPKDAQPADPSAPFEVTIRSACRRSARVSFGESHDSGEPVELDGESSHTEKLRPGEKIWLLDASGAAVDSLVVEPGRKNVEVAGDCTHLGAR